MNRISASRAGLSALLIALTLCLLLTGAAGAQDAARYALRCDAQNFSLLCGEGCTVSAQSDGATIWLNGTGDMPRVEVRVIYDGDTEGFDFADYFHFRPEDMSRKDGVEYTTVEEYKRDTIGAAELYGASYSFDYCGEKAYRYEMLSDSGSQLVGFSCFLRAEDGDAPLQAMILAIQTYQPSADYYASMPSAQAASDAPPQTKPPQAASSKPSEYRVTSAEPLIAPLTLYSGDGFSVMLPAGWRIQTMGQYNTFGFRAWNPDNPDYEIFYYGSLNPFNKSEAAKAWNQSNAWAGFPYNLYGDAPVVSPQSVEDLFYAWNDFADMVARYTGVAYQAGYSFPALHNLRVIESLPVSTYFSGIASSEALLRASFQSSRGTDCTGKLCASLYSIGTYEYNNVDMLPSGALSVSGVLAPQDAFTSVEQTLSEAVYSLNFTDSYVRDAQAYIKETGERYMAANAALQATYDGYNAAWSARQTSYDVISQKNSDATLGYDRLYDPDTGEVYRADIGFYDSYDANRSEFSNPRLQIVDGSAEGYYLQDVDYYITK